MRPLARRRKGQEIAATPPDQATRWTERDSDGDRTLRAEQWTGLVLPDAAPGSPTFTVVAISDPAYAEPLLVATPLELTPPCCVSCTATAGRSEQLPLAAKQMLGAARQFVHEQETCQRFPELALLAGAVLTYAAATSPAVPTGSWDRQPRRTPRPTPTAPRQADFPTDFPGLSDFGQKSPSPTTCRKAGGANGVLSGASRDFAPDEVLHDVLRHDLAVATHEQDVPAAGRLLEGDLHRVRVDRLDGVDIGVRPRRHGRRLYYSPRMLAGTTPCVQNPPEHLGHEGAHHGKRQARQRYAGGSQSQAGRGGADRPVEGITERARQG